MSDRVEDFLAVRRHSERGSYQRSVIDAILDEAKYCTVGFVDDGRPVVIPTIHVRIGDTVVIHGSPASRLLTLLGEGTGRIEPPRGENTSGSGPASRSSGVLALNRLLTIDPLPTRLDGFSVHPGGGSKLSMTSSR